MQVGETLGGAGLIIIGGKPPLSKSLVTPLLLTKYIGTPSEQPKEGTENMIDASPHGGFSPQSPPVSTPIGRLTLLSR